MQTQLSCQQRVAKQQKEPRMSQRQQTSVSWQPPLSLWQQPQAHRWHRFGSNRSKAVMHK